MGFNLKDEAEVQEYLENLGTEYRFGCYHEKKPEVCHLLGDFMEAVKQDFDKAGKLYKVNCEEFNHGHSCFKFGNYLFAGKGGFSQDHVKAAQSFDKGCDLNFPDSCLHAGLMRMQKSSQVKSNPKESKEKFEKGCSLKSAMSCFYLSGMYITGVPDVAERNMELAFNYSKQACELGNVYACSNLSQMYKKGEGVAVNQQKAEEYRLIAQEMQDQVTKQFRTIQFEQGG